MRNQMHRWAGLLLVQRHLWNGEDDIGREADWHFKFLGTGVHLCKPFFFFFSFDMRHVYTWDSSRISICVGSGHELVILLRTKSASIRTGRSVQFLSHPWNRSLRVTARQHIPYLGIDSGFLVPFTLFPSSFLSSLRSLIRYFRFTVYVLPLTTLLGCSISPWTTQRKSIIEAMVCNMMQQT